MYCRFWLSWQLKFVKGSHSLQLQCLRSVNYWILLIEALGIRAASDPNYTRPSIVPLANYFPNVLPEHMLDCLREQWRTIPFAKDSLGHLSNCEPPNFWKELGDLKDGNNERKFRTISDFMCSLTALPHTACVERIFSQVNLIKTKQSNALKCRTVANRILAKQAIVQQRAHHGIGYRSLSEGLCQSKIELDRFTRFTTSTHATDTDGSFSQIYRIVPTPLIDFA